MGPEAGGASAPVWAPSPRSGCSGRQQRGFPQGSFTSLACAQAGASAARCRWRGLCDGSNTRPRQGHGRGLLRDGRTRALPAHMDARTPRPAGPPHTRHLGSRRPTSSCLRSWGPRCGQSLKQPLQEGHCPTAAPGHCALQPQQLRLCPDGPNSHPGQLSREASCVLAGGLVSALTQEVVLREVQRQQQGPPCGEEGVEGTSLTWAASARGRWGVGWGVLASRPRLRPRPLLSVTSCGGWWCLQLVLTSALRPECCCACTSFCLV